MPLTDGVGRNEGCLDARARDHVGGALEPVADIVEIADVVPILAEDGQRRRRAMVHTQTALVAQVPVNPVVDNGALGANPCALPAIYAFMGIKADFLLKMLRFGVCTPRAV